MHAFDVLADPVRRRILELLADGEHASGEVVEVNQTVVDDPASVNADPQGHAWFFKLKLDDVKDMDGLMDQAAYDKLVASSA